jgi:hypothetical protein
LVTCCRVKAGKVAIARCGVSLRAWCNVQTAVYSYTQRVITEYVESPHRTSHPSIELFFRLAKVNSLRITKAGLSYTLAKHSQITNITTRWLTFRKHLRHLLFTAPPPKLVLICTHVAGRICTHSLASNLSSVAFPHELHANIGIPFTAKLFCLKPRRVFSCILHLMHMR